jgi:hypothetical protein
VPDADTTNSARPKSFTATSAVTAVNRRQAVTSFTITNVATAVRTAKVHVDADPGAASPWFTLRDRGDKDVALLELRFAPGETVTVSVSSNVPSSAPADPVSFWVVASNEELGDEDTTISQRVSLRPPPATAEKKKSPLWPILAIVAGVVAVLLLVTTGWVLTHRGQATAPSPTAAPSPPPTAATTPRVAGLCRQGFVWREARPTDHVCVTPATRQQAAFDNSHAYERRNHFGGPYGPNTCVQGFVWREAFAGDLVCVIPATRQQAADDNRLAPYRVAP